MGNHLGKKCLALCLFLALFPAPAPAYQAQAGDYHELGLGFYGEGNYEKAAEYFEYAVKADPSDGRAYENLGRAYEKLGRNSQALGAYQRSLELIPDNPGLRSTAGRLEQTTTATPPPGIPAPSPEPQSPAPTRAMERSTRDDGLASLNRARIWTRVEVGYGHSALGKLHDSVERVDRLVADYGYAGSAQAGHGGMRLGFELGFLLNPHHGLALGLGYLDSADYHMNLVFDPPASPPDFEDLVLRPSLVPLTLDYYRFFPDRGGRWFVGAGLGYYAGSVRVEENYSFFNAGGSEDSLRGDLTSGALGFQASLGREWAVSPSVGISLSARGRYARLDRFRGKLVDSQGFEGEFALVTLADGTLEVDNPAYVGTGGERYAALDFSGFDIMFGLNFYTF